VRKVVEGENVTPIRADLIGPRQHSNYQGE
jgi:hypothetical protein